MTIDPKDMLNDDEFADVEDTDDIQDEETEGTEYFCSSCDEELELVFLNDGEEAEYVCINANCELYNTPVDDDDLI